MKQRAKTIGILLSLLMLVITTGLWIRVMTGWADFFAFPFGERLTTQHLYEGWCGSGNMIKEGHAIALFSEDGFIGVVLFSGVTPVPEFGYSNEARPQKNFQSAPKTFRKLITHHESPLVIALPHWLLLILFATPPALWWRARYVQRRDKKLFEEAVASKLAEQKITEPKTEH